MIKKQYILKDLQFVLDIGKIGIWEYSFVTKTLFAYNKNDSQFSGYNIGYWQGQFKLFAFDMDSTVFKGWDQGHWVAY